MHKEEFLKTVCMSTSDCEIVSNKLLMDAFNFTGDFV